MPTYEYRCSAGHEFELFQNMNDESVLECPQCGAKSERLLSGGAGFIFKGEGFYITDYRSDDYKKAASSEVESATNNASESSKSSKGSSSDHKISKNKDAVSQPQSGSD